MHRYSYLFSICLCVVLCLASGCASTGSISKKPIQDSSLQSKAKYLHEGIDELAKKLISSSSRYQVGKIAVADFIGPGEQVSVLGEYISDKVSIALFSSGIFSEFMERKQLKQMLQARKREISGYFDQQTVPKFGKLIGVDSMVIGAIEDLGTIFDVTVKIVESETGRLQGMADICIIKDDTVIELLRKQSTATLTITVDPVVNGTVIVGEKRGYLEHGIITFTDIPYGECRIIIHPEGCEPIRRSIDIHSRTETLSVPLQSRVYEVSFQIIPPDATLSVNGKIASLSSQGFAKISDLKAQKYSCFVSAKGYKDHTEIFNPIEQNIVTINLQAVDPFYATKNQLFQKVQKVQNRQDFSIKLWTDKSNYKLGDSIYFYFCAEKDCYLNLVDVASNGEIRLIFPNRFQADNYVKGGVTYRIPGKNDGFTFEVEPPTGVERVYAIAGTRPINIFSFNFERDAFATFTRGNTRGINVKGIGVKLEEANLKSASECVINIQ